MPYNFVSERRATVRWECEHRLAPRRTGHDSVKDILYRESIRQARLEKSNLS
jgi:hypothetical protein